MTKKSNPNSPHFSRRQLVIGGAIAASTIPAALSIAAQDIGTPATPGASPAATPAPPTPTPLPPTPTPLPVPAHTLNIVRDRVTWGEPQPGGEIRLYISSVGLDDFNPLTQSQDMTLLVSVFEGLVRIDPVTMEAVPGLARSWSWSDDGLELTFKLRDDVLWHDGTPFTALDAALTCIMYRDDYDSTLAGTFGLIDDVTAVDDHTLKLVFALPDGAFVFNGASMPMLQRAAYRELWGQNPEGERTLSRDHRTPAEWIGTGAWRMESIDGNRVTLSRFDAYWDIPANADSLILIAEDDPAKRLQGWRDGDVDVLPIIASQLDSVWSEEGSLFVSPSATSMFATLNFHNPINATSTMMVDQSLRAALTMSINRDNYADEIFHGFINEHAAGTVAQPWLHDSSLHTPAYDPEGAKQVLAEGGWVDHWGSGFLTDQYGNTTELFLIVRDDERPELLALLEQVKADWAAIGIPVTIQHLWPEILHDRWVYNRDYDLLAQTFVNYPAFNEFDLYGSLWDIRSNVQGWNPGGYFNPAVDEAIQAYFDATDPDDMKAAVTTIQRETNEDLFGIWFGFPDDLVLVRSDLQGFNPDIFLYSQSAHRWWKGEPAVDTSDSTPAATPASSPIATPVR